MAKSKRRKSAMPKQSLSEPPAVQRALQKLRDFYEDGLAVIEATEASTGGQLDPKDVAKTFARERGVYPDRFWQARKFAQAYSEEQFEELCSLRRPDGKPLSATYILLLLLVKDNRRRNWNRLKSSTPNG